MKIPNNIDLTAEDIALLKALMPTPEPKPNPFAERDAAYRRALGLTDTDPIPKKLGSVSGRGKGASSSGTYIARANRRRANREAGERIARRAFEEAP